MSTLILDRRDLSVRADGDALALYENGERRGTVPFKLLERVVVQGSSIDINTAAILKLADQGAAVLFLSARQARRVAILLGPAHNDATVRLAQSQLVYDDVFRQRWAREIVGRKISRQRSFLQRVRELRPDRRKPLSDALATLESNRCALVAGEHLTESLRGFEGSAAAAYFRGYCSVFPESLEFTGRNRRPPRDPVNACLSLAYTLLHFDAVRAAHRAGLDPFLGFYHRPAFGRESLACDLIEPLRPVVDEWIWRLIGARTLRAEHFTRDKSACLLGKAGRGHFYASWESFARFPRRYLRRRCAALARGLREQGETTLAQMFGDDELEDVPS
ncbi:MAG: CRISPR-associated endonuclease Cas1 [Gammaproteobacteria bacterium]|nr:CRISPR-associated endonuclease Cas1 [Gammaproteobacteria bacterium]